MHRRWKAMMSQLKRTRYLKDNCALASGRRSRIIHENDLCSVWQSHHSLPLKSHNHPTPSSPQMRTHTHKVALDNLIHDVAHSSYYSVSAKGPQSVSLTLCVHSLRRNLFNTAQNARSAALEVCLYNI